MAVIINEIEVLVDEPARSESTPEPPPEQIRAPLQPNDLQAILDRQLRQRLRTWAH